MSNQIKLLPFPFPLDIIRVNLSHIDKKYILTVIVIVTVKFFWINVMFIHFIHITLKFYLSHYKQSTFTEEKCIFFDPSEAVLLAI